MPSSPFLRMASRAGRAITGTVKHVVQRYEQAVALATRLEFDLTQPVFRSRGGCLLESVVAFLADGPVRVAGHFAYRCLKLPRRVRARSYLRLVFPQDRCVTAFSHDNEAFVGVRGACRPGGR